MQQWFKLHKAVHAVRCTDWMSGNSHMVISMDAGKAFDKFRHPFVMSTFNKVGIEGTGLNPQSHEDKPTSPTGLNGERSKALGLRSGTREGCPLIPSYGMEVPQKVRDGATPRASMLHY